LRPFASAQQQWVFYSLPSRLWGGTNKGIVALAKNAIKLLYAQQKLPFSIA
jgi:hypothetical protein